jgi:GTPase SAR1 family protein
MPPETEGLSASSSLVLRIVGDRSSGKTTYLAALARGGNSDPNNPIQLVEAFNEDGKKLLDYAQNILEQGLMLEQTQLVEQSGKNKQFPKFLSTVKTIPVNFSATYCINPAARWNY